jgi:hypothetical protein
MEWSAVQGPWKVRPQLCTGGLSKNSHQGNQINKKIEQVEVTILVQRQGWRYKNRNEKIWTQEKRKDLGKTKISTWKKVITVFFIY